jgi:30S ribosomal protein S31
MICYVDYGISGNKIYMAVLLFPICCIMETATMGKGDIRTRRGKIYRGTYGKTSPRKKKEAQKKG